MDPKERSNYRLYAGYGKKKAECRWEEGGKGKGEILILENGKFARQWEQHVQRLRGETEHGRFRNKEEDSAVGAQGERWWWRGREASSHSFVMDQAALDFIPRVKDCDGRRFGFQKDSAGCDVEDRLEKGTGGSKEAHAEVSARVKASDGNWT